ncbi:hypothetical protein O181_078264 [Austropuccinia psidii MF-1]|uniref:Integrase catalytic domain-containing protein n=1 Tax=Austropuccinia psidii MF-1 TaxID=1389203 RepID=A0A9Q3FGK7_9BASI|nr:hypothetical protein [Austropuccinia psidii MF-1]
MDQAKVQQILNCPPPRNPKALQSFFGFANFYHCFIKNYSKKIISLTSFLKKDSCFPLNEEALSQFCQLKEAFTTTPILLYPPFYSSRFLITLGQHSSTEGGGFHQQDANELSTAHQAELSPTRKVESFSDLIDLIQKKLWKYSQYRSILQDLGKGKSVQDYSLDSSSQLLLFKDQVVVPNDPTIQLSILQKHHDSPLAGHPGQKKTLKLVKHDFHWSSMTQFIKDYVSSCQQCSRNKNIHQKKFGLLKPLPIPNGPWICLSMEFITQLPLSNSLDSILVIVERFSKMAVFIPTMSSITSPDLVHLFINDIFPKHGLPSRIVSDRGTLFVSSFWTNLCQQLKISRDLSTAYHPETERKTERVNKILEQYLQMDVSYLQDDWKTWLPLAEFAYNNSDQSSTKQSPFFTVYGRDPQFYSAHITQDTPAGKLSTKIQSLQQDVKIELEVAINWFKRYADKSRANPPVFNPGDMVWLFSKNIKSTRPTKKLSERWLGPFPILKKVSTHAYHLKLPSQWKSIHPVFHISLLEPVKTSTIPNWHQEPPPPVIITAGEEWEVSQILDSKRKRRNLWYLVEWKGFSQDSERSTWEPAESLKNCPELVKDFHSLYPDKPGPNSSKA